MLTFAEAKLFAPGAATLTLRDVVLKAARAQPALPQAPPKVRLPAPPKAAKLPTFPQAKAMLLAGLRAHGWEVRAGLTIPWAASGGERLWFRPEAIYYGTTKSIGDAHSISSDMREFATVDALLRAIGRPTAPAAAPAPAAATQPPSSRRPPPGSLPALALQRGEGPGAPAAPPQHEAEPEGAAAGAAAPAGAGVQILERDGFVQLKFENKPDATTRERLNKVLGFRWFGPQRVWSRKASPAALQVAQDFVRGYQAAGAAPAPTSAPILDEDMLLATAPSRSGERPVPVVFKSEASAQAKALLLGPGWDVVGSYDQWFVRRFAQGADLAPRPGTPVEQVLNHLWDQDGVNAADIAGMRRTLTAIARAKYDRGFRPREGVTLLTVADRRAIAREMNRDATLIEAASFEYLAQRYLEEIAGATAAPAAQRPAAPEPIVTAALSDGTEVLGTRPGPGERPVPHFFPSQSLAEQHAAPLGGGWDVVDRNGRWYITRQRLGPDDVLQRIWESHRGVPVTQLPWEVVKRLADDTLIRFADAEGRAIERDALSDRLTDARALLTDKGRERFTIEVPMRAVVGTPAPVAPPGAAPNALPRRASYQDLLQLPIDTRLIWDKHNDTLLDSPRVLVAVQPRKARGTQSTGKGRRRREVDVHWNEAHFGLRLNNPEDPRYGTVDWFTVREGASVTSTPNGFTVKQGRDTDVFAFDTAERAPASIGTWQRTLGRAEAARQERDLQVLPRLGPGLAPGPWTRSNDGVGQEGVGSRGPGCLAQEEAALVDARADVARVLAARHRPATLERLIEAHARRGELRRVSGTSSSGPRRKVRMAFRPRTRARGSSTAARPRRRRARGSLARPPRRRRRRCGCRSRPRVRSASRRPRALPREAPSSASGSPRMSGSVSLRSASMRSRRSASTGIWTSRTTRWRRREPTESSSPRSGPCSKA